MKRPKGSARGAEWQEAHRELENRLRKRAVAVVRWMTRSNDMSRAAAARKVGMIPKTIADWADRWKNMGDRLRVKPLGRPVEGMERNDKDAVLALFMLVGPGVGLPSLAAVFPDIPQAALERLLARYRKVWRWKNRGLILALRWCFVGAVWAMDFTKTEKPIEGQYPYLLMVRDLASGLQLLSLPTPVQDAATVVAALKTLFLWHGAPLVLKNDNGSPFKSEWVEALCRECGVIPLLSPPGTPEYNGAVESGIGSLETRVHHVAARNDRPGDWTCDDIEEARRQANEIGRPRGRDGSTPDDAWAAREPISTPRREDFLVKVAEMEAAARVEWAAHPERPLPLVGPLPRHIQESLGRLSVSRALVALGYLEFRRRRISPPILLRKLLKIS